MKTIKTILGAALWTMMWIGMAPAIARADHTDPVYLLKLHYDHQRDALHDAFGVQREQIECAKRDALAEWRIARAHTVKLCGPERAIALRQLAGRRREIMIRFHADMTSARSSYEFQFERLNRWYDIQRKRLVLRPVCIGPEICTPGSCSPPVFGRPGVSTDVLPGPPAPSHENRYEYQEERSVVPESDVIVPEVGVPQIPPQFQLEETGAYFPRQSPRRGFALRLGRLGILRFGG